jgi:hypothetical protein
MAADRTVQKVFLGKTGRRRKSGRQNLKRLDCIENDLKLMDVKRWRKKGEDRFAWTINLNGQRLSYTDRVLKKNISLLCTFSKLLTAYWIPDYQFL